jgi:AcrR family transcriptional regulator
VSDKTEATRARILQATLDLLEQSGGKGVRISDIAKRAGLTRQAIYLHFVNRADLLIAATLYLDEIKGTEERLSKSRAATSGALRLDAYIEAWGGYIPEIHGVAKALIAMGDEDEEAKDTWDKRMQDMREGCRAAVDALAADSQLNPAHGPDEATDILWTLLLVQNWESWTLHCGWSQEQYISNVKGMAKRLLVKN